MSNKKGINKIIMAVMAVAVYALASFLFFMFLKNEDKEPVKESINLIDSLAIQYDLNLDSLRNDSTFINELMKKIPDDEIYDRMLSYTDEFVTEKTNNDTLTYASDSLRTIVAEEELQEEYLLEFIENNRDKFQLMMEKKELKREVGALEDQIDTIARKSETIISENISSKKEIEELSKKTEEQKEGSAKVNNSENIKKLIKKYENMKPLKAAKILYGMPDKEVVMILKQMKSRQAAKILTALPPQKASRLSLLMMKDK